jgi:hypothetical protein
MVSDLHRETYSLAGPIQGVVVPQITASRAPRRAGAAAIPVAIAVQLPPATDSAADKDQRQQRQRQRGAAATRAGVADLAGAAAVDGRRLLGAARIGAR